MPSDKLQPDEQQIAQWLAPLEHDAAAPDQAAIGRINRQAGEQFLATSDAESTTVSPQPVSSRSKSGMFTKIAAALVATACSLGLLFQLTDTSDGSQTLGAMLQQTLQSDSLRLKVTREGEQAEVLVEPQGRLRWQESPTSYRISRGTKLWKVEEANNTVTQQVSPWYDPQSKQVDLLALLGIDKQQAAQFRETKAEQVTLEEKSFRRYRWETTSGGKPLVMEAIADGKTGLLRRITAWPRGRRSGPPLAELTLVARNVPVNEEQFVVASSLSEDGRIGKLVDAQGIVGLRPLMSARWTPVARQMLLKPGDWLRTDVRGANAAAFTTTTGRKLTAGPGTLVELSGPNRVKLHGGELKVAGNQQAESPFEISGPQGEPISIEANQTAHYRVDRQGQLQAVAQPPRWLQGFEGTTTNDSIGSLVVNIDGRDVPLTVGYHKVNVEIRDQIARTTIEESFVNRTNGTLEGIFHFPLPQAASISGFGMWISGELIEADVVEKQRAREIYETILREKRDPGLLEWAGGNSFKARVYPIPAHSEKRIKIVYTQVLPLRANQYRYSYGLRSEMLQTTPLRELSLSVLINSELPLKSVHSPTHEVRSQQTEHAAKLEFVAQEYTPERDFEVVCEVDSTQSDVVVVPHRRGEQGYFMVQLTPPGAEGNWQREVVPDGQPLELLLVCDTSASMDSENRRQQQEFLASLLTSLGADDRFNLATIDVNSRWLHDQPVAASGENIAAARTHLQERVSLGWTDLDRMVESILPRLSDHTHVIYVGDGIVTAHDANPQAFAARLRRLTADERKGTFHAVSCGNRFESTVLKAIAQVGGGSVRQIGGEQTPQQTAFELLNEIAQPGLRDLKVEFRGVPVAAVYPDQLPNLPAGTQQILLGRYLPQEEQQSGEIVISGRQDGQPVRFAAKLTLEGAESGNSFVPRLWARAHLDHLLAQGSSQAIQDEIIGLSEEFHIITPYTSLLVLESDADRERFNVKRRYQMRDGERFFADGKANANYALRQQQMQRAADWRLALRNRILSQLSQLGRDPQLFQQKQQHLNEWGYRRSGVAPMSGPVSNLASFVFTDGVSNNLGEYDRQLKSELGILRKESEELNYSVVFDTTLRLSDSEFEFSGPHEEFLGDRLSYEFDSDKRKRTRFDGLMPLAGEPVGEKKLRQVGLELGESFGSSGQFGARGIAGKPLDEALFARSGLERSNLREYMSWLNTLFPQIPAAAEQPAEVESSWPQQAVDLSRSLGQSLDLEEGGIEVSMHYETRDPAWDRLSSQSDQTQLYANDRWLHFTQVASSPTNVAWYTAQQRGIYSRAFQLGRIRDVEGRDFASFAPGQRPFGEGKLHETYRGYDVALERPAEDRAVLRLSMNPTDDNFQPPTNRITIDTDRHVVLEQAWLTGKKVTSRTKHSDFTKVAGVWWPGKSESFNQQGERTSLFTQQVTLVKQAAFERRFQQELPAQQHALLLEVPLPTVRQAEKATAAGAADVEHHLILLLRAAAIQQWDDCLEQMSAIEQLEPDRPGLAWVRATLLRFARQHQQARELFQQQADRLVTSDQSDQLYLSQYLLDQAQQILDDNEMLRLLDRLQALYQQQPLAAAALNQWKTRRAQALRNLACHEELLPLSRELAEATPWDVSAQTRYAQDLKRAGELDTAYAWLRQQIELNENRSAYDRDQLRSVYAGMLREEGKAAQLVEFTTEWIATDSPRAESYSQHLAALVLNDQTKQAEATATAWLKQAQVEGKLAGEQLARLNAAISFALGERFQQYMNYMEPQWYQPLRQTATYFLDHAYHFDMASRIIGNHRFRDSEQADRLMAEIAERLRESAATLPTDRVGTYVGWVVSRQELSREQWKQIADTLRERWNATDDSTEQSQLGSAWLQVYRYHFSDSRQLPFMRKQIERAAAQNEESRAAGYCLALFNELLSRDWKAEHEAEAIELIERVSAAEAATERLARQIGALHRFVDRMLAARYAADMEQLHAREHPEELTRTELAAQQEDFREAAKQGVAERLKNYRAEQDPKDEPLHQELLQWFALERMYLDLKLDRKRKQVAKELWGMLGDQPPLNTLPDEEQLDNQDDHTVASLSLVKAYRLQRAFEMVNYLAAQRSAPDSLVERLERYIASGLDQEGEAAAPWKVARYRLQIALDRPDRLQRELREWIRTDPFPAPWQLALARLVAERGKIEQAITLMETVEKASQLTPADYAMLADWYLVADNRAEYERAQIEVFKVWPENQIINWLRQQRQPWSRSDRPLPTELSEEVLFAFRALFEKSSQPENYVSELREFYTASRDFRLLQMLPDAVTGRTPQQVYPLLENLKSRLMSEIRKEATADELLARVATLREQSESAIDLRALDLLEVLIERQAAEVLNQPGVHIDVAVAALERAFDREWAAGEVRQMASFLDELGTLDQPSLADLRLQQLHALHQMTQPGTDDRLMVSWYLAHAQFYSHNDRQGAVATMQIALREFEATHQQGWPSNRNPPLDGYLNMLESMSRFAAAEQLLTGHLEQPLNEQQKFWLLDRRDQTYREALRAGGQVSLGSGQTLYDNLHAELLKRIEATDDDQHRYGMVNTLLSLYNVAEDKHMEGYQADLTRFAFEQFPGLMQRQTNNYSNLVGQVADSVKQLISTTEGLRFLIERYENYPARYQYTWNNAWRELSYRLVTWHKELDRAVGDLEPRLLKIVLAELRRELRTGYSQSHYFFHRNYSSYYWEAKQDEFMRVAEEVLAERSDSGRGVTYIARYMYGGLHHYQRAIEVLLIAHGKGLLDDPQQIVLVDYLQNQDRHAESIPILEPLIDLRDEAIGYRTRLIKAYFHAQRPEQMRRLVVDTDSHFREQGLWSESTLASLAQTTLEVDMHAEAVAYYEELIALHQRAAAHRGIGGGTLAQYYRLLSQAYSALGNTRKAVDAAAAGVVAWGPRHDQRQSAIGQLRHALAQANDLAAYVKFRDQEAQQTGQDSPLIRRLIGEVYADRGEHAQAIEQLKLALELQSTDLETHQQLIAAYKATENRQGVIEQTLALLDLDRHNLQLYRDLARRLADDEELAERAATTIVEAAPGEAEHHAALAELRQSQDRWSEAIEHWQQVARLRSLEPTGLLKLAEAQLHEQRWDAAERTLDKLRISEWPSRFGNVQNQVDQLRSRLPQEQQ